MIDFDFHEPELFCSVGLITGTGGAGRVSKQKQESESGTRFPAGFVDEATRRYGAPPVIANMDPYRTTELPYRRYTSVGMPPNQTPPQQPPVGQGGGAGLARGAMGTNRPEVAFQRDYGMNANVSQGPIGGGAVPISRPEYGSASNAVTKPVGGPPKEPNYGPPVPAGTPQTGYPDYERPNWQSMQPDPSMGPVIQWDQKQVQKQLKNQYGKHAEFYNVPSVTYNPTPEELNFQFDEARLQDFGNQGIPTAPSTQDYGDTFRLPMPQGVFTPDVYDTVRDLGFTGGQAPVEARGAYGDIALANAAQARAATIPTTEQEFRNQSQRLYEAEFSPIQRELLRQQDIGERDLKARLANAGLSTSGTGIAQQTELARDFGQRLEAASTDAANRASSQAFGMQQEQRLQNAANQQQTALANAGFSQQVQLQNAANLLTRQGQVDQNYLAAMGLSIDQANQVRDDFLALLGLEAADFERVDAGTRANIEMMFNSYLNLFTTIGNIGRYSTGTAVSTGPGGLISY